MAKSEQVSTMNWFQNNRMMLLYAAALVGWALLLGPQLQERAQSVQQFCVQQWQQWQPLEETTLEGDNVSSVPTCKPPGYTTRIVSYNPFIMHIENFVSVEERKYLLEFGTPLLQPSPILLENGSYSHNEYRTSNTAFMDRTDPINQCILERASQLQGFIPIDSIEDLQLTTYQQGQQYNPHYDWSMEHLVPQMHNQNRGSTFFVTLDADCENCGTQFPRLSIDWRYKDQRWCEFVDCENIHALTVKAKPGSAVFWQNLDAQGYGNPNTLHAGLPVPEGKKIGMNIWTRVAAAWTGASSSDMKWRGL